ncbi:rho GTPase-activating protein 7-like isoform X2 [Eriocheir sinensis]|uniref:rho GTPase-activating protein 7-like isoform X2 n=1 Tax=Eriocheir sinensis TaxID=95602 RepID=UPI0021C8B7DD|nr:rho GTPase-activating protein 7-like isoform X2 [Eriocheir sinensis]
MLLEGVSAPASTHGSPKLYGCRCVVCNELEALEACKWLRAAGFPQYAQMYEELQFPLDLVCVERDHSFLERDSLQALFRRLSALNRCARIRLDSARKNKAEESDDDEVAISDNWRLQRPSRRWSRIVQERSPSSGGGGDSRGLEVPDEALLGQFKRSGSERLKDGAKAILRRMESLKNKKKKRHRDGVVISSPKLLDEAGMRERVDYLACVDLPTEASPMLTSLTTTTITTATTTTTPATAASSATTTTTTATAITTTATTTTTTRELFQGEDSSDHSQGSTPLSRARRRRRLPRRGQSGEGGGGGAHSDSEYSPQTWRHHYLTDANSNTMAALAPASSSPKHQQLQRGGNGGSGAGGGRGARPGQVRQTGSLNYGKDSQNAREHFLASIRGGVDRGSREEEQQASPPPSPGEDRHSVYDNVPLIICNKIYHDYQPEGIDSETSVPEGSGSSESRDSPLPSTHDEDDNDDSTSRGRATVERWHSFNRRSYQPVARQLGTQINGFSSGQTLHLRKRALLRLTALMERCCPSNRSGWNWELPKFMRKMKTPDYRERQVFGVPLQVVAQRTGQPLPPGIQAALQYLRATSLDQVGIFRKPGVRSRIQKLRELHENNEDIVYSSFGTCDIADMVKTYFRELPEVLLTNKLSEMYIAIFQYLPNEHRLEALQCAVLLLPDENREVLMALLTFLADVAANAPLNQMTASNLAVCLAPSLFHLSVGSSSGSSPLRRRPGSAPEQRDLHENMAAHQCLSLMIQQVSQLQCVPMEMLTNCRFTYLEQSQPVCLEDLGVMGSPGGSRIEGDWTSYMNACITSLLKEAREKSRGWISMNCSDPQVEVLYRKVGDGHPLRLWRATTEVEAPPAELLNRVIRERHMWDDSLFKWRVVCRLDRQSDVFQYMCNSMPPRPPVDYCVLRYWRTDLARGSCVVAETSVEHADAPVLVGGVRGIVLASRYLIQPCGSGKSRITHISRVDMRGRTPEWYNKIYGHMTATHLRRIRQSFQHHAIGPESKV